MECLFDAARLNKILELCVTRATVYMYTRSRIYTNEKSTGLSKQPYPGNLYHNMPYNVSARTNVHTVVVNEAISRADILSLGYAPYVTEHHTFIHSKVPNKGAAISEFRSILNVCGDTMSFGDDAFDVSMFKATKYAVSIGQNKEIGRYTDYHIPAVSAPNMYVFGKQIGLL